MLKNQKICFFLFVVILLFVPLLFTQAATLDEASAYQGIVKINTYYEDSSYFLSPLQSGSGIIINDNGLILTNSHVVSSKDSFGNPLDLAFEICLTTSTTVKPDCQYSADLIAQDESLDIALLKIKNISGLDSKSQFDYIALGDTSEISEGDSVKALGYPAIGGETITTTSGTISGTLEKYASKWLKTDTSFSFGSSGGALIDESGDLLGITSAAYSDLLGSLGFVIDISSISGWINDNKDEVVQIADLQSRMENFISKENNLKTAAKFINASPQIEVSREDGWEFNYESENSISIESTEDDHGGSLSINWDSAGYDADFYLDAKIKFLELTGVYFSEGDIDISGITGKKVVAQFLTEEVHQIILPVNQYEVAISYYYGEEDAAREAIDSILDSIKVTEMDSSFTPDRYYQNDDPFFVFNLSDDWVLKTQNSVETPVTGASITDPNFDFSVVIEELSEGEANMDNDQYYNFNKDDFSSSAYEYGLDLESERYFSDQHYKLSDELNDIIFYKYKYTDDEEEVKIMQAGFRILDGDKVVVIEFEYLGGDEDEFENSLEDFQENELAFFTLGRPIVVSENSNEDSVSDEPEEGIEVAPICFEDCNIEDKIVNEINEDPISPLELEVKNLSSEMGDNLVGKIILEVEQNGEAWYLSPITTKAYFLGRPDDAFQVMREQGVGITNEDLVKIPVAIASLSIEDSDGDGLSDMIEDALGTDKNKSDTDGDGYGDMEELISSYDPTKGEGVKSNIDNDFTNKQKGKILLQVEGNGEAWYVNPTDGKRYFLGRPVDAFEVMRNLGLGISNENFEKL